MTAKIWKLRTQILRLDRPVFMGIVNVTPDSFSDGGRYFDTDTAVWHSLELVEQGAGILDIGGESTRPGSDGVSASEELRRILPVIEKLQAAMPEPRRVPISVDTTRPEVAAACLRAGAEIVNDVSPETSPEMLELLLETGAAYCLMHSRGAPKTMQLDPRYDNVVEEVFRSLRDRRDALVAAGVEPERIAVDPGLGFGKTVRHNWELVEGIERFHDLGAPVLVGHSRKRFIAETFEDRDAGTREVTGRLIAAGVQVIRVHEIGE